ncbi:hydroxyphenylacetyl-CoA thioesterase PaaI [Methermicoccus shengliensis]|uniref:Hydroxyphenylacetyl-CoA thioesterase PaaI n=1 Tax=Methermicoccus shengliensis TaxID=660064 RepID=A0A832VM94_9EURY|nr:hydroxyphenylacetyl-CoA thioesterase PaaI [Methermicoccus shengliensis]KUK04632.1 MAG: Phenylacetic acid degradation protein PaaD [Euryarchaeota archaeon 55_53]KUK30759.1 MAG: Phenylacetic acid degradation protein PaaD [Methanosarcinales archeaon 56_1174]MDI3488513.1 acyl-CoA thioesterase [Methanosarcinales archaeon]MDN5295112.1 acyl-CoA thioesterase [Methanosarcinales archaeon]HIH69136.1 hydroxyphenylacetyl-CoA thioesterase PaaI [Methermicoccus shengliensis]
MHSLGSPYADLLGMRLIEKREGYAKVEMRVEEEHLNSHGFAHGGLIFSLADSAFAMCCNYGGRQAVAIEVSVQYMAPAVAGDVLTAEAHEVKRTRRLSFCRVEVRKGERLIAAFQSTSFIKE